jgi:hypothetical protein
VYRFNLRFARIHAEIRIIYMAMKITLLAGIFACCSFAQPPEIIRVVREGPIQAYVAGKAAVNVVGMSAIAGPAESWLIELHDSFASVEDLDKALKGAGSPGIPGAGVPVASDEVLPSSRAWIARFRPGLSYRPEQAIQYLAKARYLEVMIYQLGPGAEADFSQFQKLRRDSLDSVNSDRPDMAYEVISGAPSGSFLSLTPFATLKSLDDGRPPTPVYAEGVAANANKLGKSIDLQRERLLFRVEPYMSYVSDQFAAPDPGYWHPAAK